MASFVQIVTGWLKPDTKRKVCLGLMAAGTICFFISLVIQEIYQYDVFNSNNIFPIASGAFTIIVIVYGLLTFIRPLDIIFMIMLFATMDLIALLVIGVAATVFWSIVSVVLFTFIAIFFLFVFGSVLALAGASLPLLLLVYGCVFLYQSVDSLAALLHTNIPFVIIGIVAIILLAVYTTTTSGDEHRKPYEIIVAIILAYFIAWPVLSATNNINSVFANKLGKEYKIMDSKGYRVVKNKKLSAYQFYLDIDKLQTDYYNVIINNHKDGNSINSVYLDAYSGDYGFYTASLDGKEVVAHVNSWNRINKPFVGSSKDVAVVQYSNWTFYLTSKKVIAYKMYNSGVFETNVLSKEWKQPIDKVSEQAFREVIMADLINQSPNREHSSSSSLDINGFARVAYAQKNGYLVDFDNSTEKAVFAKKDKNKITFEYFDEAGKTEEIATIEREYKGEGVGYFKYEDDIYYVDNTKLMKLNISTKKTTTLSDLGQTIYSLNYVVFPDGLACYYIQEDSYMVQYYYGETITVSSNGLYKAKDVIGFNYCNNHLVITYKSNDFSIFKKIMAFVLNKEIPSKPIGIAYIKFKD